MPLVHLLSIERVRTEKIYLDDFVDNLTVDMTIEGLSYTELIA